MKDLVKKVAVGLATGALVSNSMVMAAFGTINVQMTGNGSESASNVSVGQTTTNQVTQTNTASVQNNVSASSNTGGNDAGDNTGSNVNIDTGNAKSIVEVSNTLNSNEASLDCASCPVDLDVEVSGNGTKTTNDVKVGLSNTNWVTQNNYADVSNDVDVDADTGDNDADDNTGGDVTIDTGTATAYAGVSTTANANVAHVGGSNSQGGLDVLVTGNGSKSDTTVGLALANVVGIEQSNLLDLDQDVEVDADTGDNDADDNTGGLVSIDTGAAWAGAQVDTLANFNMAHVEDCCEFDGLVKVAGNGTKSTNDVELGLVSTLYAVQDNDYSCGGSWFPSDWFWGGKHNDCDVDVDADTGNNDVNDSTDTANGDPSIDTGNATTEVEVNTEANSNVFETGDAMPHVPGDWDMGNSWWMAWMFWGV